MIRTKTFKIGEKDFITTFSDKGLYVERDGVQYASATDLARFNRQYVETDEPIFTKERWDRMTQEQRESILNDIQAGQEQIILAL